jgi:hypothetical protein
MKAYIYHSAAHRPVGLCSSSSRDSVDYYVRTSSVDLYNGTARDASTARCQTRGRMSGAFGMRFYKAGLPDRCINGYATRGIDAGGKSFKSRCSACCVLMGG